MIGIIDYGMGNLRSVQKAFEAAGQTAKLTQDPEEIQSFAGLVLPGVGAFGKAMENLNDLGLVPAIQNYIQAKKPFLGICLGLQLLFTASEESFGGEAISGLDIIAGRVVKFPPDLKIPQIGWNQIIANKESRLLKGVSRQAYVYFVHSYYVRPQNPSVTLTTTEYGISFVSSIALNNVYAIQFHPEKSSTVGLKILSNFGAIIAKGENEVDVG